MHMHPLLKELHGETKVDLLVKQDFSLAYQKSLLLTLTQCGIVNERQCELCLIKQQGIGG